MRAAAGACHGVEGSGGRCSRLRPGAGLLYVERTKKFYRCELRDHGPEYGIEAQFLNPVEVLIAHTFPPHLDPTRSSREMAIAWAEEERKAIEAG